MRVFLCTLLVLLHPFIPVQADEESAEVRAWRELTKQLESAGVEILKTYPQPDALDRAEGLRYLLQQRRATWTDIFITHRRDNHKQMGIGWCGC